MTSQRKVKCDITYKSFCKYSIAFQRLVGIFPSQHLSSMMMNHKGGKKRKKQQRYQFSDHGRINTSVTSQCHDAPEAPDEALQQLQEQCFLSGTF